MSQEWMGDNQRQHLSAAAAAVDIWQLAYFLILFSYLHKLTQFKYSHFWR